MNSIELAELFKNPTNEYRGKPFWSWNGDLEEEELKRQIHVFQEMGMGGFFMHSRVGLKTPYLGEKWFSLINACTQEAKKLGMEAWLYDEDRWPSGTAGGKVTKKKENRMKFMLMHIDEEIPEGAEVLYSCFCEVDGICFTENSQRNRLWFEVVEFPKDNFYNGFTYVDTLKRSATEDFIQSTHQKYREYCGEYLGNGICGIFTDEPHRGHLMCDAMYDGLCAPYTDTLFEDFEALWGYSLRERLPELFLQKNGEAISQVKWHYMELLQQMFLENFLKPVHTYCNGINMKLTGHMLHEDTLSAQTIMHGSVMRAYEHMDIPGVDVLGEGNVHYCIVKQLSSVANQLKRKWMLSELYGCTGWKMSLEGHKNVGDWQALMGVNVRCHHLSWYTMKGEGKRDYPASIFHQSAWYKDYRYVEDYFSRLGVFLSEGEMLHDSLVINPVESVWCQIHAGFSTWLEAKTPAIQQLEEHYHMLYQMLLENHVGFDLADEEMLSRLYRIDGRTLFVGAAEYKRVIVSGMCTIRRSTVEILNRFAENGGEIIVLGEPPKYVDALPCNFDLKAKMMPFSGESVRDFENTVISVDSRKIFSEIRKDMEKYYIMLLNIDREHSVQTTVQVHVPGYIEEWSARTGERFAVREVSYLEFAPGEEKLFVITLETTHLPQRKHVCGKEIPLTKIAGYTLEEKNICVLDHASVQINGQEMKETDVLRIDRRLREKFCLPYRGGDMLQPWFVAERELQPLGKLCLNYEFQLEYLCDMSVAVELEREMQVRVNGVLLEKTGKKWIDICFDLLEIPKALLLKGKNVLTLSYDFYEDSNVEAVYLLGDFGVRLIGAEKSITVLPENIGFGEIREYGFPFYSGKITYHFKTGLSGGGVVRLKNLGGAAVAEINGAVAAFSPYEVPVEKLDEIDVSLVMTRQNTFGELHAKSIPETTSPNEFIPSGDAYQPGYNLIKQGLYGVTAVCEDE